MENRLKIISDLEKARDNVNKICFALSSVKTTDKEMITELKQQITGAINDAIDQLPKRLMIGNK